MIENTTVAYTSRSKYQVTAVSGAILMALCLMPAYLILSRNTSGLGMINYFSLPFSFIGVILFSPPLIYSLYRSFIRGPAVALSLEGIHDTSSLLSAGLIRWSELSSFSIDHIGVFKILSTRVLVIITHDPQPILERMPILKRLTYKINIFDQSPFMISEQSVEGSLDDLSAKIQDYFEIYIKPKSQPQ